MRILLLLLLIFIVSCSAGRSKKSLLALRADIAVSSKQSNDLPYRIQIKEIEPTRLADHPNIVVRETDYTVKYERSAEWAIRPVIALTDMIEAEIIKNVPCNAVKKRYYKNTPDLLVSGTLVSVEDDQRNGKRFVNFKVFLQLSENRTEQVLFNKVYSQERTIDITATYSEFAAILNDIMNETAKAFSTEVANAIKSKPDETKHSEN